MRVSRFALPFAWFIACTSAASAHAQGPVANAIVLVMESGGGVRAAAELRALLSRQSHVRLLSLAEVERQHIPAAAVLTVATDPAHTISVVYWDLAGASDSLSAPTPTGPGQIEAVVMALVSAMIDRHRAELLARDPAHVAEQQRAAELQRTSRVFYAMVGQLSRLSPRTNVELRFEDF